MSIADRSFEFETLGRRYAISRRPPADALGSHVAAEVVRIRAQEDRFFRSSLAHWACMEGYAWTSGDELRIIDELVRNISAGMVRVHVQSISEPSYAERHAGLQLESRASFPTPPPPIAKDEIVDIHRSLIITHCPPEFEPRTEPLRIAYLLRELHGFPVELTIRREASPEPPVHRRMLAPAETVDGPSTLAWDGRGPNGTLIDGAGPFLVELVYDDTYRDQAKTALRRVVHVLTMDGFFHTGSAMFLPSRPARGGSLGATTFSPSEEIDQWRAASTDQEVPFFDAPKTPRHAADRETVGLTFIAYLLAECGSADRSRRLILAGHTTMAGSNELNDQLSEARARCVWALLTGSAEEFAAAVGEFWSAEDGYLLLRFIANTYGWPCDPGETRNYATKYCADATRELQRRYNEEFGGALVVDGDIGPNTRAAIFALLQTVLENAVGKATLAEQRQGSRVHGSQPLFACGERYSASKWRQGIDDRRVEALMFLPDESIPRDADDLYEHLGLEFVEWSLPDVCAPDSGTRPTEQVELLSPALDPSEGFELVAYEPYDEDDPWDFLNAFDGPVNRGLGHE